jgi:hypothetical protein
MPGDVEDTGMSEQNPTRAEAIRVALRRTWGLNVGEMEHPVNLPTFDAALRAAGYIVVPVEPTEAMLEAADMQVVGCCNMRVEDTRECWATMIAAAEKEASDGR